MVNKVELTNDCVDNCNVALVSYGHQQQYSGVSLMRWLDVYNMATQVAKNCLFDNQQGGAGVLFSMSHLYCTFDAVAKIYVVTDLSITFSSGWRTSLDIVHMG